MRIKALLFFISTFLVCANVFSQYNWTRDSSNPVLTGDTTAIQNLADPSVIYDNGVYKLWCGCVQTNPAFASVCYSESTNGSNWSAPIVVFSPNLTSVAWDNMKTEIPTVIKDTTEIDPNKLYKMWYGGADSLKSDSTRMGYAYSPDGQVWTRISASLSPYGLDGLVLVPGYSVGDAAVISDPSVCRQNWRDLSCLVQLMGKQ